MKIIIAMVLILLSFGGILNADMIEFDLSKVTLTANIISIYYIEKLMLEAYIFIMHALSMLFYSNAIKIIVLLMVFKYFSESLKSSLKGNTHIWLTWIYQSPTNNILVRFFILMALLYTLFQPVSVNQVILKVEVNSSKKVTAINYVNNPKKMDSNKMLLSLDIVGSLGSKVSDVGDKSIAPLIAVAPIMLYQMMVYGVPQGKPLPTVTPAETSSIIQMDVIKKLLVNNMIGSKDTIEQFLYILKAPTDILNVVKRMEGVPIEVMTYAVQYDSKMAEIKKMIDTVPSIKREIISNHIDKYLKIIDKYSTPMSAEENNFMVELTLKHLAVSIGLDDSADILSEDADDIRKIIQDLSEDDEDKTFVGLFGSDIFQLIDETKEGKSGDNPTAAPQSMYNMFVTAALAKDAGDVNVTKVAPPKEGDNAGYQLMGFIGSTISKDDSVMLKNSLLARYNIMLKPNAFNGFKLEKIIGDKYADLGLTQWDVLSEKYAKKIYNSILSNEVGNLAGLSIFKSNSYKKYPMLIKKKGLEGILINKRFTREFVEDEQFQDKINDIKTIKKYIYNKYQLYVLTTVLNNYYAEMLEILSKQDYTSVSNSVGIDTSDEDYPFDKDDNQISASVSRLVLNGINKKGSSLSINTPSKNIEILEKLLSSVTQHTAKTDLPDKRKKKLYVASMTDDEKAIEDENERAYKNLNSAAVNDNNSLYSTFLARAIQFGFEKVADGSEGGAGKTFTKIIQDDWDGTTSPLQKMQDIYDASDKIFNKGLYNQYTIKIIKDFADAPALPAWVTTTATTKILNGLKTYDASTKDEVKAKLTTILAGDASKITIEKFFTSLESIEEARDIFFTNWLLNDEKLASLLKYETQMQRTIGEAMSGNFGVFSNILFDNSSRNNVLNVYNEANPSSTITTLGLPEFVEIIKQYFSKGANKAPHVYGWVNTLTDVITYVTMIASFNPDNVYEEETLENATAVEGLSDLADDIMDAALDADGGDEGNSGMFGWLMDIIDALTNFFFTLIQNIIFNFFYLAAFILFAVFILAVSILYGFWLVSEYIKWGFSSIYTLIMTASAAEPDWKGLIDTMWKNLGRLLRAQTGPLFLAMAALIIFILGEGIRNLFYIIFLGPISGGAALNILFFAYVILTAKITEAMFAHILQGFMKVTGMDQDAKYAALAQQGALLTNMAKGIVKSPLKAGLKHMENKGAEADDAAAKAKVKKEQLMKDGMSEDEAERVSQTFGKEQAASEAKAERQKKRKEAISNVLDTVDNKLTGGMLGSINDNVINPLKETVPDIALKAKEKLEDNSPMAKAAFEKTNQIATKVVDTKNMVVDKATTVAKDAATVVVQKTEDLTNETIDLGLKHGGDLVQKGIVGVDRAIQTGATYAKSSALYVNDKTGGVIGDNLEMVQHNLGKGSGFISARAGEMMENVNGHLDNMHGTAETIRDGSYEPSEILPNAKDIDGYIEKMKEIEAMRKEGILLKTMETSIKSTDMYKTAEHIALEAKEFGEDYIEDAKAFKTKIEETDEYRKTIIGIKKGTRKVKEVATDSVIKVQGTAAYQSAAVYAHDTVNLGSDIKDKTIRGGKLAVKIGSDTVETATEMGSYVKTTAVDTIKDIQETDTYKKVEEFAKDKYEDAKVVATDTAIATGDFAKKTATKAVAATGDFVEKNITSTDAYKTGKNIATDMTAATAIAVDSAINIAKETPGSIEAYHQNRVGNETDERLDSVNVRSVANFEKIMRNNAHDDAESVRNIEDMLKDILANTPASEVDEVYATTLINAEEAMKNINEDRQRANVVSTGIAGDRAILKFNTEIERNEDGLELSASEKQSELLDFKIGTDESADKFKEILLLKKTEEDKKSLYSDFFKQSLEEGVTDSNDFKEVMEQYALDYGLESHTPLFYGAPGTSRVGERLTTQVQEMLSDETIPEELHPELLSAMKINAEVRAETGDENPHIETFRAIVEKEETKIGVTTDSKQNFKDVKEGAEKREHTQQLGSDILLASEIGSTSPKSKEEQKDMLNSTGTLLDKDVDKKIREFSLLSGKDVGKKSKALLESHTNEDTDIEELLELLNAMDNKDSIGYIETLLSHMPMDYTENEKEDGVILIQPVEGDTRELKAVLKTKLEEAKSVKEGFAFKVQDSVSDLTTKGLEAFNSRDKNTKGDTKSLTTNSESKIPTGQALLPEKIASTKDTKVPTGQALLPEKIASTKDTKVPTSQALLPEKIASTKDTKVPTSQALLPEKIASTKDTKVPASQALITVDTEIKSDTTDEVIDAEVISDTTDEVIDAEVISDTTDEVIDAEVISDTTDEVIDAEVISDTIDEVINVEVDVNIKETKKPTSKALTVTEPKETKKPTSKALTVTEPKETKKPTSKALTVTEPKETKKPTSKALTVTEQKEKTTTLNVDITVTNEDNTETDIIDVEVVSSTDKEVTKSNLLLPPPPKKDGKDKPKKDTEEIKIETPKTDEETPVKEEIPKTDKETPKPRRTMQAEPSLFDQAKELAGGKKAVAKKDNKKKITKTKESKEEISKNTKNLENVQNKISNATTMKDQLKLVQQIMTNKVPGNELNEENQKTLIIDLIAHVSDTEDKESLDKLVAEVARIRKENRDKED